MRGVSAYGDKVKGLRQLAGMTQEELAVGAHCDVKTVRRAEKGGRLDVTTVRNIAKALGVDYRDIARLD